MTGTERRKALLAQVESCVCKDRQNTYGDAEDNFADIAALWNVVLGNKLSADITAADVGVLMVAVKMARYKTSPHHIDNAIDGAGYWVCVGGIIQSDNQTLGGGIVGAQAPT